MVVQTCGICKGTGAKRASSCVGSLYDSTLKSIGLNAVRYVLMTEMRHLPRTMTALSEALTISRQSLSQILRPLERAGFFAVVANGCGEKVAALTTAGLASLDQADVLFRKAQEKIGPKAPAVADIFESASLLSSCPKRALFGFVYPETA